MQHPQTKADYEPPQGKLKIYSTLVRWPVLSDLLLIIIWMLLWKISSLMEYAPHASIWFPPAGLTFSAILLLGLRAIPPIACCCMAATFWENIDYGTQLPLHQLLETGALFALAHISAYATGACLLKLLISRRDDHQLPSLLLAFTIIGPLSALLASYFTQTALVISGVIADSAAGHQLWLPLWVGDLLGILVLTPLLIGLLRRIYPRYGVWVSELGLRQVAGSGWEFLLKLATAAVLMVSVMSLTASLQMKELAFAIFFLCIPQMWIVYTETPLRSGISIALMSFFTAVLVKYLALGEDALIFQFSISVLAASTYFGLLIPVLASSNSRLREMTRKDSLTNAYSRQHFFQQAEQEILRARYYRQPISVIVFDIDSFKQINDRFGHTIGDLALISLANLVNTQLRQADMLGRFGGDEFMLLLPGSDQTDATATAERLRQALPQMCIAGISRPITGSFGVTEITPTDTISSAFEKADALLLEAKRRGRNLVLSSFVETSVN
ncbi:GGDEF domain-containing protein [Shewanella fodinae]|uniref:GGDEF domain-containing protein n=1 Tax=Shewanella fodinae TaxID=552357 RepID=UPI00167B4C4F|nr:diguanylate cyclase [Shewanella fodinae]MCL2906517.1 diguanylate cyclase [Shewanella fodinae]